MTAAVTTRSVPIIVALGLIIIAVSVYRLSWDRLYTLGEQIRFSGPVHALVKDGRCSRANAIEQLADTWGMRALELGQSYPGTGVRMEALLRKLDAGQPITMGVIGGSITTGHGLDDVELRWSHHVFRWINSTWPHPGHRHINGAIPATGTDYFANCFEQHIDKNSDLIIVEEAVNDAFVDFHGNSQIEVDTTDYTETMARIILGNNPTTALMMLSAFVPDWFYINGAEKHSIVSEYYDIPRVSTKPFLYRYLIQNEEEKTVWFDQGGYGHPSAMGHRYMADLVIYHLEKTICRLEAEQTIDIADGGSNWAKTYSAIALPETRIGRRIWTTPRPPSKAFCLSANIRDEAGAWGLAPVANTGFSQMEQYDKSWWIADQAGSTITFADVEVHAGSVGIYYFRSAAHSLGDLFCWVDDDKASGQRLKGYWTYGSVGSYGPISKTVSEGKHSVTCEVLRGIDPEGEHARIIAVIAS